MSLSQVNPIERQETPSTHASVEITKEILDVIKESGIGVLTDVMEKASNVASKGVSVYLFTMAAVLLFFGLLFKIGDEKLHIGKLTEWEYIATFATAIVLALSAAFFRLYIYNCEFRVYRDALQHKQALTEKKLEFAQRAMGLGKDVLEAGKKMIQSATDSVNQTVEQDAVKPENLKPNNPDGKLPD